MKKLKHHHCHGHLKKQSTRIFSNSIHLEKASVRPKIKFGELDPDSVPIFGFPFPNYSPINKQELVGKMQSDQNWGMFTKQIISNVGIGNPEKTLLITDMIYKRDENCKQEKLIQKALTFGYKLIGHKVDPETEKRINHKELHIVDGQYFTGGHLRGLV